MGSMMQLFSNEENCICDTSNCNCKEEKEDEKNWNYLNQQCVAQQECGPSVDEELLMVTSVLRHLRGIDSVEASRHNLTSDPDAFVNNSTILKLLQQKGNDILPVTLLDGEIVKERILSYVRKFGKYGAIHFVAQPVNNSGGCCGGNDGRRRLLLTASFLV